MKNNKAKLLAVAVALGVSAQANAAIELYNQDGTTFSADGHFNAFYTSHDSESGDQSRVRMGFLPNYIGFNVSKQIDDLKVGGRSSFWVNINDSTDTAAKTATGIDVRQFYATVDGDFGQILFGKDFSIYQRTNILSDELLLGVGVPAANGTGTTFGDITTGYAYASPTAQITYRTPVNNGFQLAVGLLDPSEDSALNATDGAEDARFEAEATYASDFDGGSFKVWLGGAYGDSVTAGVDATGLAYGAQFKTGGFTLTASGFDQEGISSTFASQTLSAESESDGYLVQASYGVNNTRFVVSHGETDHTTGHKAELDAIALFYDINSNLKLIAEYSQYENADPAAEDVDTLAIGAALSW